MVMTHLASVADRIGRSYSPCGGREERDLDNLFKEPLWRRENSIRRALLRPPSLPLSLMHG